MKNSDKYLRGIVNGCIDNDRKYQEEFYRYFFPTMHRMIRSYTKDEDAIIDIINNGFLKTFKSLDTFKWQGSLEGWLRKIMYRSLYDYMNAKSKKNLSYDTLSEHIFGNHEEENYFLMDDLNKHMNGMPNIQKNVFRLYALEGYKHKEISKMLNINENTSKWYLSEAKKFLQNKISKAL